MGAAAEGGSHPMNCGREKIPTKFSFVFQGLEVSGCEAQAAGTWGDHSLVPPGFWARGEARLRRERSSFTPVTDTTGMDAFVSKRVFREKHYSISKPEGGGKKKTMDEKIIFLHH